tara:strand:- start:1364 stop:1552 length:189 start_codon:yes stop_codon:yes gene_type:complete
MSQTITQGELIANITANGLTFLVCIVQETGENWMGQQVIKSRNYKSMEAAQRGAAKMLEALS